MRGTAVQLGKVGQLNPWATVQSSPECAVLDGRSVSSQINTADMPGIAHTERVPGGAEGQHPLGKREDLSSNLITRVKSSRAASTCNPRMEGTGVGEGKDRQTPST